MLFKPSWRALFWIVAYDLRDGVLRAVKRARGGR